MVTLDYHLHKDLFFFFTTASLVPRMVSEILVECMCMQKYVSIDP